MPCSEEISKVSRTQLSKSLTTLFQILKKSSHEVKIHDFWNQHFSIIGHHFDYHNNHHFLQQIAAQQFQKWDNTSFQNTPRVEISECQKIKIHEYQLQSTGERNWRK